MPQHTEKERRKGGSSSHNTHETPGTKAGKQAKVGRVLGEFKSGDLRSSSGAKVTKRSQAVAIALSEAGLSRKGGSSHNTHGVSDLVEPLPILNAQLGHDHDAQRLMDNLRRGPTS